MATLPMSARSDSTSNSGKLPVLFIVPETFPTVKLETGQSKLIESAILRAVARLPANGPKVTLTKYSHEPGFLKVMCANVNSQEWLEKLVRTLTPWPDAKLKGMAREKNLYIVSVIDAGDLTPDDFFRRLSKQNVGLKTSMWKVVRSDKNRTENNMKFTVSIDDESVKYLRANNHKLRLDTVTLDFRSMLNGKTLTRRERTHRNQTKAAMPARTGTADGKKFTNLLPQDIEYLIMKNLKKLINPQGSRGVGGGGGDRSSRRGGVGDRSSRRDGARGSVGRGYGGMPPPISNASREIQRRRESVVGTSRSERPNRSRASLSAFSRLPSSGGDMNLTENRNSAFRRSIIESDSAFSRPPISGGGMDLTENRNSAFGQNLNSAFGQNRNSAFGQNSNSAFGQNRSNIESEGDFGGSRSVFGSNRNGSDTDFDRYRNSSGSGLNFGGSISGGTDNRNRNDSNRHDNFSTAQHEFGDNRTKEFGGGSGGSSLDFGNNRNHNFGNNRNDDFGSKRNDDFGNNRNDIFGNNRNDFGNFRNDFSNSRNDVGNNRNDVGNNRNDFGKNINDFFGNSRNDFDNNRNDFGNDRNDLGNNQRDFGKNFVNDIFGNSRNDFDNNRNDFGNNRNDSTANRSGSGNKNDFDTFRTDKGFLGSGSSRNNSGGNIRSDFGNANNRDGFGRNDRTSDRSLLCDIGDINLSRTGFQNSFGGNIRGDDIDLNCTGKNRNNFDSLLTDTRFGASESFGNNFGGNIRGEDMGLNCTGKNSNHGNLNWNRRF